MAFMVASRTGIKILKISAWVIGVMLFLFTAVIIAIRIPSVQNFIVDKATTFVSGKTGTTVNIGNIYIGFPAKVIIHEIFLDDLNRDTLLYAKEINAGLNIFGLIRGNISLGNVAISALTAAITRNEIDSTFNFNFLIEALAGKKETSEIKDTVSKPLNITVDEIQLANINFSYNDEISGINLSTHLGEVEIPVKNMNLDSLWFMAGDIVIKNSQIDFEQTKISPEDTSYNESPPPRFSVTELVMLNSTFTMRNKMDSTSMLINSGSILLSEAEFNLENNFVRAEVIDLDKSSCLIYDRKIAVNNEGSEANSTNSEISIPFVIDVQEVEITNSKFGIHSGNPTDLPAFDPNNLLLAIIQLSVQNIYHDNGSAGMLIKEVSIKERSGIAINQFHGQLKIDPKSVSLTDLFLKTSNSEISGNLAAKFESMKALSEDPGNTLVKVELKNSVIGLKDIVIFNADLLKQEIIKTNLDRLISINLTAQGSMDHLEIANLALDIDNETFVNVNGTITGLPDINNTLFDLEAKNVSTTSVAVKRFVKIPETINLPEDINLKGTFLGTVSSFNFKIFARTSRGNMLAGGSLMNLNSETPGYSISAIAKDVQVGYILKNETLGQSNLTASVTGIGFKPDSMKASYRIKSDKVTVKAYTYKDIELFGDIKNGVFSTQGAIADTNVDLSFTASVGLIKENEFYNADLKLNGIDFMALNLADKDLRAKGTGIVKLKGNKFNDLEGTVSIQEVLIIKEGKNYPIETLAVIAFNTNPQKSISVESSLLTAMFSGSISIDQTPKHLQQFVKKYFSTDSIPLVVEADDQNFIFSVEVKNAPVISEVFVPGLDSFIPGPIVGQFSSRDSKLDIAIQLPQVIYSGIRIDSLDMLVYSGSDTLNMIMGVKRFSMGDIQLTKTDITVAASNNIITTKLRVSREEQIKLNMVAQIVSVNEGKNYRFSFPQNEITLNNEKWNIPNGHHVDLGGDYPQFNSFSMTHENKVVTISTPQEPAGLSISFKDFQLADVSGIIERDTSYMDGVLNGDFVVVKETWGSGIKADITLNKFQFRSIPVGDFDVKAWSEKKGIYAVEMKMTGNDNDVDLKGKYAADSTNKNITAEVDITRLSLKSMEPFTNGAINRSKGYISGSVKIGGDVALPDITGEISFIESGFHLDFLNNYFNLANEKISFKNDKITFDSFTITDTLNQNAVLNGSVDLSDKKNPVFRVDLKTDKFLAMNTPPDKDKPYYGTLIISSNVKIRGNKNLPVITSSIKLLDGSSFTFVVPESSQLAERGEEDVKFTDPYNRINEIIKRESESDTAKAEITGMDISSNIEITKETTLRILVDRESGDSLVIRGDATMSFSIDPSGKTSLTGGFEINEGSYRVSLQNLVKKNFAITKGSSINWRGDLTDADVDIDAVAIVNAVPLELVADQVAGLTEQQINAYRQRLPFQVILHMRGELMTPEINFEIALPPEDQGVLNGTVFAKLNLLNQNPSELNKQVFALLVLNRFVQENPFDNQSGGGVEYVARNSASKILSQQLNTFADQFIKGVELNFDVQSYEEYTEESVEGRTEVNLGVKKTLFNDRLIVEVGGNIDVEGERTKQNDLSNLAGDIVLEYLLVEDGRYRLRVFRKDQYAGVLDGEVQEEGVGFLYNRDFDNWDQLFRKPKPQPPFN